MFSSGFTCMSAQIFVVCSRCLLYSFCSLLFNVCGGLVMLLAGDIGGTKTHLAIFTSKDNLRAPVWEKTFPSANYASLEALVDDFLSQSPVSYSLSSACFGVAGPVIAGKAK